MAHAVLQSKNLSWACPSEVFRFNDLITAMVDLLPRRQLTADELAEIIHERHRLRRQAEESHAKRSAVGMRCDKVELSDCPIFRGQLSVNIAASSLPLRTRSWLRHRPSPASSRPARQHTGSGYLRSCPGLHG